MSLETLQKAFKEAAVSRNTKDFLETYLPYEKKEAQGRFAIYQNNIMGSLSRVLAEAFPACEKLVGEEFFRHKAYQFIERNPPQKAALLYYGDDFIRYFEGIGHDNNYAYWGEVAAYEWAQHSCYYGADAQTLSLQDLATFDGEDFGSLVVILAPAVQLLKTTYNVQDIIDVVKAATDDEEKGDIKEGFEIEKTHDSYLFYPTESKSCVEKVSPVTFKALEILQQAPCSFEDLSVIFSELEDETVFASFITLLFDKKLLIRM